MAKIFATKAFSMVLCFVMLFMGAPVTTWAITVEPSSPSITVKGNAWLVSPGRMEVKLTANGFTDTDSVQWSADSTNVSFSADTGATTTLSYTTLVGTDTDVTVTAQNDAGTESATTVIKLSVPDLYWTDEDGNILTGFDPNNPYMLPVGSKLSVAGVGRTYSSFSADLPTVYSGDSTNLTTCVSWNDDKTVVSATSDSGETIFKLRASYGAETSPPFDFYFKVYQPSLPSVTAELSAGDGTTLVGDIVTLDATGFGLLNIEPTPSTAAVSVSVSGDGIAYLSRENRKIYIVNAGDGAQLTITATAKNYLDYSKTLTLKRGEPKDGQWFVNGEVDGVSTSLTTGSDYTLDSKGDGTLMVATVPTAATVTVEVDGAVNEEIAKYEYGVITITGAADGADSNLTIKAEKAGYTFADFKLTLKRASAFAPSDVSFSALYPVYNKDLALSGTAWARLHMMIGTISSGDALVQFDRISVKNALGETVVDKKHWYDFLCDDEWAHRAAVGLRSAGYLSDDELPVCLDMPNTVAGVTVMNYFSLGTNSITLTTLSGQEFTTSINVVGNDFRRDTFWTTGSSDGLLIAKMPNITNDLLDTLISDLKISKDGTQLFEGKGNTEILEANTETGNVFIKNAILDTLEAGTYQIGFTVVGNEESLNFTVVDHRDAWGDTMTRPADRKVQYVDAAGKTSIELTSENLDESGILWLLEESGGTSAWYGIDLSTGAFELDKGSCFYVQWLHQDDAEYDTYYDKLDDEQKSDIEGVNGWIFLIGVEDASGYKVQPNSPVKTYVQIGDDWDLEDLKAYYIAAGEDPAVPVDYLMIDYPEGTDIFGIMTLSHFSPYLIMDARTDAEKAAIGKGNNKTGDQAVQVAVAGLGSILVLAIGIMLRLITSKKKFEE